MKWSLKSFAYLCLFLSSPLLAQQEQEDYGGMVASDTTRGGWRQVISPEGLFLRAKPDRKSQVLRKIPFGEKVQVVSARHFGRDTVGQFEYFNFKGQPYQVHIDGFWVKVVYKKTEGYMFSAYLGWLNTNEHQYGKSLNQDFALLFASLGCNNNINYHTDWYWYGVYAQGDQCSLKPVKVSFYNLPLELAGDAISTNENRDLQFVIGSRTPLPENALPAPKGFGNKPLIAYDGTLIDSTLKRYKLTISRKNKKRYWDTQKLVFQRNGLRQEFQPPFHDGPWVLHWCGDLDGDRQDDYVITFGDKGAYTLLFLSKSAAKGQIVKPVAIFLSGYCC